MTRICSGCGRPKSQAKHNRKGVQYHCHPCEEARRTPRKHVRNEGQRERRNQLEREARAATRPPNQGISMSLDDIHIRALKQVAVTRIAGMAHDAHVKAYRALSEGEWWKWKYDTKPEFRLHERLRKSLRKQMKREPGLAELIRAAVKNGRGCNQVEATCGYSIAQFKAHIERQFTNGMGWDSWTKRGWHVDHILPAKCFDLTTDEGVQAYWPLSNLRPLWSRDNLKKSHKVEYLC